MIHSAGRDTTFDISLLREAVTIEGEALESIGRFLVQSVRKNGIITSENLIPIQVESVTLARMLAEHAAAKTLLSYADKPASGDFEKHLASCYAMQTVVSVAQRARYEFSGITISDSLRKFLDVADSFSSSGVTELWNELGRKIVTREREFTGATGLTETHQEIRSVFSRFSDEVICPIAEKLHRKDTIIPDSLIEQLSEMGVFGISIPQEYGGNFVDHLTMVIATEELSRGSLGAGGSVLTRPEICAKALLAGGTETQRQLWLPKIASGEKMVCIAVTEPNTGSDVANVMVTATKTENGYLINGEKTWATFAGRSELICLLARTGTPDSGHRGLSLFLVEKPYDPEGDEYHFKYSQSSGGVIEGHAIPTIGYRGMHSFSVSFDNYFVPIENMIGEEGRGFYLQMQGFAGGRIQTAARAVGVMEAALQAAIKYTRSRKLFGRYLSDFPLTRSKLARMAGSIQANRQLTYQVAELMDNGGGSVEASLVKLLACKDAEWVTREAMQLHGGMGYSEEYPASRYFLDARVLSIFEGAEEVLALQVIVRPFLQHLQQN